MANPLPRILVVEDDPAMSRLMLRCLSGWGWKAEGTPSVSAALERFERENFDAVLCDADLPDGDGVILAGAFAKLRPSLLIVVASGCTDNLDRARSAGLSAVLQKPFEPEALRALLQRSHQPGFFRV